MLKIGENEIKFMAQKSLFNPIKQDKQDMGKRFKVISLKRAVKSGPEWAPRDFLFTWKTTETCIFMEP